jgi:hypothetical protein
MSIAPVRGKTVNALFILLKAKRRAVHKIRPSRSSAYPFSVPFVALEFSRCALSSLESSANRTHVCYCWLRSCAFRSHPSFMLATLQELLKKASQSALFRGYLHMHRYGNGMVQWVAFGMEYGALVLQWAATHHFLSCSRYLFLKVKSSLPSWNFENRCVFLSFGI